MDEKADAPWRERFDATLRAAVDAVIIIDHRGIIETVNEAAERTFGYHAAEMLGRNISLLMPERYAREHDGYLERYLETGEPKIIGIGREVEGRRKDGTVFPMDLAVGEGRLENQRFFVGLVRDLSARRELEARLAHVSRLSTLGEMAAGIAHEVNQPLGAIANYAQALRLRLDRPEVDRANLREIAEKISTQALRAGDVIRRLRNLARRHEGGRRRSDVNALIREIVPLAELEARLESVRIELRLAPDLPEANVDQVQIQQVVLNLIRNGVEAMSESDGVDPALEVVTHGNGDGIVVEVADRGQGVDRELWSQILDPFVSSKDSGMGLGLSICRSIVTSHGGDLEFEAREGGGTVFRFSLPVEPPDPGRATD